MKEEALTKEQRDDLVKYYFERAHESIEEAKYLRDGGYYNGEQQSVLCIQAQIQCEE